MELKHTSVKVGEDKRAGAASRFAASAVLVGSLAFAACTPNVNVNVVMDKLDASATPKACLVVGYDEGKTVDLRPSGSVAGPSSSDFSGGKLSLLSIVDKDGTKAANLELTGCNGKADATLKGGDKATLTIGDESVTVQVVEIVYESNGPRVRVTVTPIDNSVRNDAATTGPDQVPVDSGAGPVDSDQGVDSDVSD